MKREKALLGEAEGGGLRYDLRLAHTYTQEGERDGISQRIKSFAIGCFAAGLVFFYLFFFFLLCNKVRRGLSVTVLDSSVLEWGCVTVWTGKWAAGTGGEYFSN